jgi:Tol biopolymer transport system component
VWAGHFAFSEAGALAYATKVEESDLRSLVWADRQGSVERLTITRGIFSSPRLSPDGRMLAVVIDSLQEKSNIWTVDVETGTFTRLTSEGNNILPIWTPDGKRVTYASDRQGQWNIFWEPLDGSGPAELLRRSENPQLPNAWSPDGKHLAFTEFAPGTGPDIWLLSMAGERNVLPLLRNQCAEWGGAFSPDGRWFAYTADESGVDQIYVCSVQSPGEKHQVSTAEGREPVWGRDGKELFFRDWKGLMSVGIQAEPDFNLDPPHIVVSGEYEMGSIPVFPNYDVSADGQRFILIPQEQREKQQINLDLNWFEELKPRNPKKDST